MKFYALREKYGDRPIQFTEIRYSLRNYVVVNCHFPVYADQKSRLNVFDPVIVLTQQNRYTGVVPLSVFIYRAL